MSTEFKIQGEFLNPDATKAYPNETRKWMKSEVKKLVKVAKVIAKERTKKHTGNLLKGIKAGKTVYKWKDADYNIRAYFGSPAFHGHLIEKGHKMLSHKGDFIRKVDGFEILETANNKFESQFYADIEDEYLDFIIKELEK